MDVRGTVGGRNVIARCVHLDVADQDRIHLGGDELLEGGGDALGRCDVGIEDDAADLPAGTPPPALISSIARPEPFFI